MSCPSMLTCFRFAEGQLAAAEAATFESHLAGCSDCTALVAGFHTESQVLRDVLQTVDTETAVPVFSPRPSAGRLLGWMGLALLAAWSVNLAWSSLTSSASLPGWLGWLAPDSTGVLVQMALSLVGLATGDGSAILEGVQTMLMVSVLIAVWAGVWSWLKRKVDHSNALCLQLGLAVACIMVVPSVHAFELRRDDARVVIPAGEVIDDTLIVASERVLVEGTITGDLIALGEQVTVTGQVGGLVVAAGEVISVEGDVGGSVLGLGETLDFRGGTFNGNLYAIGEKVTVHDEVSITGNGALAGSEVEVHGGIGRDLLGLSSQLTLFGTVQGGVRAYAQKVDLSAGAEVGGDLNVRVVEQDDLTVADGASVGGETVVSIWPEQKNRYLTLDFYLGEVLGMIAAFLAGLLLFYLVPSLAETRLGTGSQAFVSMGIGAVALVATPVLAVLTAVTLIGAPVGIITFLAWLVALYLAGIVTAAHLGRLLLDDERALTIPLLVGLGIITVLGNLPFVGGLVRLLVLLLGLGLLVLWLRDRWLDRSAA